MKKPTMTDPNMTDPTMTNTATTTTSTTAASPAATASSASGSQASSFQRPKGKVPKGKVPKKSDDAETRWAVAELMRIANHLEGIGDLASALRAYGMVLKLDASVALAHLGRGAILMQGYAWAESVAAFQEAARLDPEDALAYTYLGHVLDESGQGDAAASAWAAAEQRDPELTRTARDMYEVSARFRATGSAEDSALLDQLDAQAESQERRRHSREQRRQSLCHGQRPHVRCSDCGCCQECGISL